MLGELGGDTGGVTGFTSSGGNLGALGTQAGFCGEHLESGAVVLSTVVVVAEVIAVKEHPPVDVAHVVPQD
jgi:nitrate/nitrite transporter NarK